MLQPNFPQDVGAEPAPAKAGEPRSASLMSFRAKPRNLRTPPENCHVPTTPTPEHTTRAQPCTDRPAARFFAFDFPCLQSPLSATDSKSQTIPRPICARIRFSCPGQGRLPAIPYRTAVPLPPPGGPQAGPRRPSCLARKTPTRRHDSIRLESPPLTRSQAGAEKSAAPVAHRGDTGGGEGPTIRDMGPGLALAVALPTGKSLPGEGECAQERRQVYV